MNRSSDSHGYSADVRLQLVVGDRTLELAQISPHDIVLRTPVDLPPGEAEVVMQVNGHQRRWRVLLPDGAAANTPIAHATPAL